MPDVRINFKLTGVEELDQKFAALPLKVQKKILRGPLRQAAKMIQATAKIDAPVKSGVLAKSLRVRAGKRSRRTANRVSVVVITAKGWFKGPAFYAPFVLWGHGIGKRPRGGKSRWRRLLRIGDGRKRVKANNFLRRATDETGSAAQAVALGGIRLAIIQAASESS